MLGVSVATVQLWVEDGLLDAWKTSGGHRRVQRVSIERLLHRTKGASATEVAQAVQAEKTPALKVMVIDDDADLLRLYEVNLRRWPNAPEVVCVDNVISALLMIERSSPDLLIVDLSMPRIDGFEMLRILRKAPESAQVRIVVVTGLDQVAIDARGGLPQDIEVLKKPVPFERLREIGIDTLRMRESLFPAA